MANKLIKENISVYCQKDMDSKSFAGGSLVRIFRGFRRVFTIVLTCCISNKTSYNKIIGEQKEFFKVKVNGFLSMF